MARSIGSYIIDRSLKLHFPYWWWVPLLFEGISGATGLRPWNSWKRSFKIGTSPTRFTQTHLSLRTMTTTRLLTLNGTLLPWLRAALKGLMRASRMNALLWSQSARRADRRQTTDLTISSREWIGTSRPLNLVNQENGRTGYHAELKIFIWVACCVYN